MATGESFPGKKKKKKPASSEKHNVYWAFKFTRYAFACDVSHQHSSQAKISFRHPRTPDRRSQAKFSFRQRGHRTGLHTGANSTPLEGPRTPSQQPYSISRRAGPRNGKLTDSWEERTAGRNCTCNEQACNRVSRQCLVIRGRSVSPCDGAGSLSRTLSSRSRSSLSALS